MCRGEYLTSAIFFAIGHSKDLTFGGFVIGWLSAFLGQESTNNDVSFSFYDFENL